MDKKQNRTASSTQDNRNKLPVRRVRMASLVRVTVGNRVRLMDGQDMNHWALERECSVMRAAASPDPGGSVIFGFFLLLSLMSDGWAI